MSKNEKNTARTLKVVLSVFYVGWLIVVFNGPYRPSGLEAVGMVAISAIMIVAIYWFYIFFIRFLLYLLRTRGGGVIWRSRFQSDNRGVWIVSDRYWLTEEQMARLEPYIPKSQGKPRLTTAAGF